MTTSEQFLVPKRVIDIAASDAGDWVYEDPEVAPVVATEVRYKMADGSLVGGEFTYVGELEFFDDCDEPVELIREVVAIVQSEPYTHVSSSAQLYLDCLAEAEAEDAEKEP